MHSNCYYQATGRFACFGDIEAFTEGLPNGSYQQSCKNCTLVGNNWLSKCECKNSNGDYITSTNLDVMQCASKNITVNTNGQLMCGDSLTTRAPPSFKNANATGRRPAKKVPVAPLPPSQPIVPVIIQAPNRHYRSACKDCKKVGRYLTGCKCRNRKKQLVTYLTSRFDTQTCQDEYIYADGNGKLQCGIGSK